MTISSVAAKPVSLTPNDGARGLVQIAPSVTSPAIQKAAATEMSTQAPSPERVVQAVRHVNEAFAQNGQNLHAFIEIDKATGIDVVKIQDRNTKEVISQFPPKAVVAMAEAIIQNLEKKVQMINVSA